MRRYEPSHYDVASSDPAIALCGSLRGSRCAERAGRLWSATFEGDALEFHAISEHFDGHLPTFLAGPEAQGGLYGAGEYGSYGLYGDADGTLITR